MNVNTIETETLTARNLILGLYITNHKRDQK